MRFIRAAAPALVSAATMAALLIGPALAQQTGVTQPSAAAQVAQPPEPVAYDGQKLSTQPPAVQQGFREMWGPVAADRWVVEHNLQLITSGYVVPAPPPNVPPATRSASVSIPSADDDGDDNDNGNANDNG